MKVKLVGGAELDILTRDEVREELSAYQDWYVELRRGVKWVRRVWTVALDGSGNAVYSAPDAGPAPGMTWAVTKISHSASVSMNVYVNTVAPSGLIAQVGSQSVVDLPVPSTVLHSADRLTFTFSGGAASSMQVVSIHAIEVPTLASWLLLGR